MPESTAPLTAVDVPGTPEAPTLEPLPAPDYAAQLAALLAARANVAKAKQVPPLASATVAAIDAEIATLRTQAAREAALTERTNETADALTETRLLVEAQGRHIATQDAKIAARDETISQLLRRLAALEKTPPPVEEPDPDPVPPLPVPPPVVGLALHQHGRETDPIHATWADGRTAANPFDCWDVEVSRDGQPLPSLAACVTLPEHHVPLPGPGARYGLRVRAHRSARENQPEALGPWSPEVFLVAFKADPEPDPDPVPVPDPGLPPVSVTGIESGEDFLLVRVAPVAGAVDYAVSDPDHPGMVKASAGLPVVEWPDARNHPPKRLVLQALAGYLPYQRPTKDNTTTLVNGHGDAGAPMPNVIAQSTFTLPASAVVKPHPERARGATFLDLDIPGTHRTLFAETPIPPGWERRRPDGSLVVASAQDEHYRLSHPNGRTHLICVATDRAHTFAHVHHGHLEVAVYDGGTPPASVPRNNYSAATLVDSSLWRPLKSGGVIRFGMRTNPTHTGRRWIEVGLRKRGAPVVFPNRTREDPGNWYPIPPQFGDMVRVTLDAGDQGQGGFYATYITPDAASGRWVGRGAVPANPNDWQTHGWVWRTSPDRNAPHVNRNTWNGPNPDAGTDIGSAFEVEFSEGGARLFERSAFDGKEYDIRGIWPAGVRLAPGEYEVYVTFMVYHSSLEEQDNRKYAPYFDQFIRNMNDHHVWHLRDIWINDAPRLA